MLCERGPTPYVYKKFIISSWKKQWFIVTGNYTLMEIYLWILCSISHINAHNNWHVSCEIIGQLILANLTCLLILSAVLSFTFGFFYCYSPKSSLSPLELLHLFCTVSHDDQTCVEEITLDGIFFLFNLLQWLKFSLYVYLGLLLSANIQQDGYRYNLGITSTYS